MSSYISAEISDIVWGDSENIVVGAIATSFDSNKYFPINGTEVASGTTTSTKTNSLVDSTQSFRATVRVGYRIDNVTDGTTAYVTAVVSNTELTLNADIMTSGESYSIKIVSNFNGRKANFAKVYAGNGNIRYWQDGRNPTSTVGWYVRQDLVGLSDFIIEGATNISNFRVIRASAYNVTISVQYGWSIKNS